MEMPCRTLPEKKVVGEKVFFFIFDLFETIPKMD